MTDPRAVLEALRDRMKRSARDRRALSEYQERIAENHAPMALRAAAYDTESWVKELDAVVVGLPSPVDCSFAAEVIRAFLAMGYCPSGYDRADLSEFVNRLYTQAEQIDAVLRPQAQEQ